MKITVLTLDEKPRLEWRKALTEYYQKTGDWTVYRLMPCIIVSESDIFEEDFEIGDGRFFFPQKAVKRGNFYVLPPTEGRLGGGLFVSFADPEDYVFPEIRTSAGGLALLDITEDGFRILRQRRLQKDRGKREDTLSREAEDGR